MTHTHDTLMALADTYAYVAAHYAEKHRDKLILTKDIPNPRAALSAALQEVLAERDALAKDAARYRWLRDDANKDNPAWCELTSWDTADEKFDAITDFAMKGTPT